MKARMRRATAEELKAFEMGTLNVPPVSGSGSAPNAGSASEAEAKAEDGEGESARLPEIRIEGYDWLSDEVLHSLSKEAVVEYAIQQREIISFLVKDRQMLVGTVMNYAERNNLLLREIFGRKTNRLQTIIGRKSPKDTAKEGAASDGNADADGDGRQPETTEHAPDSDEEHKEEGTAGGSGGGSAGNGPEPNAKKHGEKKPRRTEGCIDKQCEGLPVVENQVTLTDEELDAFFGQGNWHRQESNDRVVTEYVCVPRQIYVRKTILSCYAANDPTAETVKKEMVVAPSPVHRVRTYSRLTEGLLGNLFYFRYGMRLPWERITQDLSKDGLRLNPQQLEENARYYYGILMALLQRMWCILFSSGHIQIDETPVLIYDQREDKVLRCWFWVFTVSELFKTDKRVVLFVYAHGRDTDVLRKHLVEDHKYQGYATSDGHSPYHIIEEETGGTIKNTGCLNHLRTKLIRVIEVIPGLKKMSQEELEEIPAFRALDKLRVVFKKERLTKDMTAEERKTFRQEEVVPELKEVFADLMGYQVEDFPQGSQMHEALTYLNNQKKYLERFAEDGNIPLTNSHSERCNSFFALIRNCSRLFGSDSMAETGAGWESLIQTARMATDHVDIYFQYLFSRAVPFIRAADLEKGIKHTAKTSLEKLNEYAKGYFNDERLDQFMPWSVQYKEYEAMILEERKRVGQQVANATA